MPKDYGSYGDPQWIPHPERPGRLVFDATVKLDPIQLAKELAVPGMDVDYQSNTKETALHIAARYNNLECAKLLVNAKADLNVQRAQDGSTPLMVAAEANYVDFVKLMKASGADDQIIADDRFRASVYWGKTAWDLADHEGRTEVAAALTKPDEPFEWPPEPEDWTDKPMRPGVYIPLGLRRVGGHPAGTIDCDEKGFSSGKGWTDEMEMEWRKVNAWPMHDISHMNPPKSADDILPSYSRGGKFGDALPPHMRDED